MPDENNEPPILNPRYRGASPKDLGRALMQQPLAKEPESGPAKVESEHDSE
jgi:hypothetical protein